MKVDAEDRLREWEPPVFMQQLRPCAPGGEESKPLCGPGRRTQEGVVDLGQGHQFESISTNQKHYHQTTKRGRNAPGGLSQKQRLSKAAGDALAGPPPAGAAPVPPALSAGCCPGTQQPSLGASPGWQNPTALSGRAPPPAQRGLLPTQPGCLPAPAALPGSPHPPAAPGGAKRRAAAQSRDYAPCSGLSF